MGTKKFVVFRELRFFPIGVIANNPLPATFGWGGWKGSVTEFYVNMKQGLPDGRRKSV